MIKPQRTTPPKKALSTPEQTGERLSKRVAALAQCSRREAEQLIEGGWVQVNGQRVEESMARVTSQTVVIDPGANPMALSEVTLLLHKPPGFETMAPLGMANKRVKPAQTLLQVATHWPQDASREHVLKRHFAKLTAGVPLENAASGLVVFTQDWRVLRKLTEDAAFIEHEFVVEVQGEASPEALHRMNTPPVSERGTLPLVKVSINSTSEASTRLRFAVKGAHPGLAAYLCERAGLHILSLKRQRVGRVTLAHLPEGQWRYLAAHERF